MTSVATRPPLEHMSTNRAAHSSNAAVPRRRSVRHFDDDDGDSGAPPAKKQKSDAESKGMMTNGKANGTTGRRGKKAYEESDDGFTYTRSTRTKAKPSTAAQTAPAKSQSPPPEVHATKRRPRKTLPVTPEKDEVVHVRRSKRLSGENEAKTAGLEDPFVTRTGKKAVPKDGNHQLEAQKARDDSPAAATNGDLFVAKKRAFTQIPLNARETPIIRRNQDLRRTLVGDNRGGDDASRRRSSAGLRGKRVSDLHDAGSSAAVPHTEVETRDFYKHIGQDLLEPKRMRTLLVFCAKRVLEERKRFREAEGREEQGEERQALDSARVVENELLAEFTNRSQLSNWFDRTDDSAQSISLVKKPNPRNVQNAAKLAELEKELARLQAERRSWDELTSSVASAPQQPTQTTTSEPLDPALIDAALLDESQAELLHTLLRPFQESALDPAATRPASPQPHSTAVQVQDRLNTASSTLHFKLDSLADSLHRLERYVDTAGRVADRISSLSAARLEQKQTERRERGERENGNVRVGDRDLLRAAARALAREGGGGGRKS